MDENRIAGSAKSLGGKAEESLGRVTGDAKTQAEGVVNQVSGAAQDLYGQARDTVADAASATRDTASSFENALRHAIENQPYTAVVVALILGWLLGKTYRPL
jgi:uncharacterized protein YjbJ (UPF0337 family)